MVQYYVQIINFLLHGLVICTGNQLSSTWFSYMYRQSSFFYMVQFYVQWSETNVFYMVQFYVQTIIFLLHGLVICTVVGNKCLLHGLVLCTDNHLSSTWFSYMYSGRKQMPSTWFSSMFRQSSFFYIVQFYVQTIIFLPHGLVLCTVVGNKCLLYGLVLCTDNHLSSTLFSSMYSGRK